jgi:hypothetical protein
MKVVHQLKFKFFKSKKTQNNNTHRHCLSLQKPIKAIGFFLKKPIKHSYFTLKLSKNQIHHNL